MRGSGSNQSGTSLAELLTGMLFLSIVSAMSYSFARTAFLMAQLQESKGELQEVAVATLDLLVRDVRMAGFSAIGAPLVGLRVAGPDRIEVASDLNGDGDLADENELMAYSYDATNRQLMRATGGTSPQPVARNVSGIQFAFFDAAGAELTPAAAGLSAAQCDRVRRVDVQLSVELPQPDPLTNRTLRSTVTTSLQLRNR
jgi:Tfp pilus assembly protein PilW